MLYPDFNELLQLRSKVTRSSLVSDQRVKSSQVGDHLSPFRGNGMEFEEVRQYVIGDDIRKIDWLVTARLGLPHIKVFKEERQLNVTLCVDMNHTMRFGTRGTFKSVQAARVAALLGWCANVNNDSVGAYLFGDLPDGAEFFRPKSSRQSLWKMLKSLSDDSGAAGGEYVPISSSIEFLHKALQPGGLVFIISDFMNIDDEFRQQLCYLTRRSQVIFISVNDPSDMEIPNAGNILFAENDSRKIHISTASKSGAEAYRKQWQENRSKLERIASDLGIRSINIRTNSDVFYDLFYGLKL
ncbi:MAG: DUF58 domain-containing protein [Rickettsiales bacterium]|nr:MAG: DUF58 domain-containing protein [Rickettsiales bacterium]